MWGSTGWTDRQAQVQAFGKREPPLCFSGHWRVRQGPEAGGRMACEITCAQRSQASARGLQLELTSEHAFDCSFPSTSILKEQHQAEGGGSKIPPALLSLGGTSHALCAGGLFAGWGRRPHRLPCEHLPWGQLKWRCGWEHQFVTTVPSDCPLYESLGAISGTWHHPDHWHLSVRCSQSFFKQ